MQDTRYGRIVIAESHEVPVIVQAVTDYVARRMVEREQALVSPPPVAAAAPVVARAEAPARPRTSGCSLLGFIVGALPRCSAGALYAALSSASEMPSSRDLRRISLHPQRIVDPRARSARSASALPSRAMANRL